MEGFWLSWRYSDVGRTRWELSWVLKKKLLPWWIIGRECSQADRIQHTKPGFSLRHLCKQRGREEAGWETMSPEKQDASSSLPSQTDQIHEAVGLIADHPAAMPVLQAPWEQHLGEFTAHRANSKVGPTGSNQLRWVLFSPCRVSKRKMLHVRPALTVQEASCKTTKLWHFLENEETWKQESINFIRPWLLIWEKAVSLRWGMCPPSS